VKTTENPRIFLSYDIGGWLLQSVRQGNWALTVIKHEHFVASYHSMKVNMKVESHTFPTLVNCEPVRNELPGFRFEVNVACVYTTSGNSCPTSVATSEIVVTIGLLYVLEVYLNPPALYLKKSL
jgi:hypothetical protein